VARRIRATLIKAMGFSAFSLDWTSHPPFVAKRKTRAATFHLDRWFGWENNVALGAPLLPRWSIA
jgi:hypothetical protein